MGEDDYLAMIGLKSASVVAAICRASAVLGRRSDETIEAFARFGFNAGMAMQLLNDVVGCSHESATRNDLRTSKQTLPVIFGLNWAARPIQEELTSLLDTNGRETPPEAVLRVRSLLESCGGLEYAEVVADVYWERAASIASSLSHDGAGLQDIIGELRGDPVGVLV
jgi:geranylgeranyl pyrophosphate synthase